MSMGFSSFSFLSSAKIEECIATSCLLCLPDLVLSDVIDNVEFFSSISLNLRDNNSLTLSPVPSDSRQKSLIFSLLFSSIDLRKV